MEHVPGMRYFLFSYTTQWSVGSVIVGTIGFPSHIWLVEHAIPGQAKHLLPGANIVITGFTEFASAEDFESYAGGFNMDMAIKDLMDDK